MSQNEKYLQYAQKLSAAVSEIFNEDNDFYINQDELFDQDENNLTHFFHALANVMPTAIYEKLTNDEKNWLEFNHMANQLVFQYSKKNN